MVIPLYHRMVVFRRRKFVGVRGPGLHFLPPLLYNGVMVDIREQEDRLDAHCVIQGIDVEIDFTVFYRVLEDQAEKAVIQVVNWVDSMRTLAVAELMNIFENITLSEALADRESNQNQLRNQLDHKAERWGIRVAEVRIHEITTYPVNE